MDLFSSNPRSFKLDRKSTLASQLKRLVVQKLQEFIGNYTDDVLAEYIVVLICNGKTQNQARDDLKAFLGQHSGAFVAWLWDHLSRCIPSSGEPDGSLNVKELPVESCQLGDTHDHRAKDSHNNKSSVEKHRAHGTFSSKPVNAEEFERWCPESDAPLTDRSKEVFVHGGSEIYVSRFDDHSGGIKSESRRMRSSSGTPVVGQRDIQKADQHKKIGNNYNNHLVRSPNKDPGPRNMQSIVVENRNLMPVPTTDTSVTRSTTRASEPVSFENSRRRGNVWDRLGKPSKDNSGIGDSRINHHEVGDVEHTNYHGIVPVEPDGNCQKPESYIGMNTKSQSGDEIMEQHVDAAGGVNSAVHSGRKRKQIGICSNILEQSCDIRGKYVLDRQTTIGLKRSLSAKSRGLHSDGVMSDAETPKSRLDGASNHPLDPLTGTTSRHMDPKNSSLTSIRQETSLASQRPVLLNSSLISKSENLNNAESRHQIQKPAVADVLDVKLRLKQLEMEMNKLRSRQAGTNGDIPVAALGIQHFSEADIDSRTAFVTNVHFAASREALSLHFSKCGEVLRVTLLTDTVTGQPKGCAYIVFACKDSVDKALALSGTSFFSRTLRVVSKVDMQPEAMGLLQSPLKSAPSYLSPPSQRKPFQRQFSGSHLQWRRDLSVNSGNSQPAQYNDLANSQVAQGHASANGNGLEPLHTPDSKPASRLKTVIGNKTSTET